MGSSLATLIKQLKARRDAIFLEISLIDTTKAGGLPNAGGAGVQVDHLGYKRGLYDELKTIQEELGKLDVGVVEHEGR